MKIITASCVCACIRTSPKDDTFPREGGGCVYLMILFESFGFGLSDITLLQVILCLLGISIRSVL